MRLKKCGVYVAFIRELKNRSGKVFQHRLIELLSYDRNLIDFAFIWDRTKDGWEFWSKKNKTSGKTPPWSLFTSMLEIFSSAVYAQRHHHIEERNRTLYDSRR